MEYWIKHSRYKIGFLPVDGFGAVEGFAGQDNSLEMERSRLGGLTPASVANVDFFGADIMDNCLVMIHDRKVRYLRGIRGIVWAIATAESRGEAVR